MTNMPAALLHILFALRNRHLLALDLLAYCVTPVLALALRVEGFQSVPQYAGAPALIDGILVLLTAGGLRYSVRLAERLRQRRRNHSQSSTRVAIIGAWDAGAMIAKEMQANPRLGLEPAVFLDDDPRKHGMWIHGVPVAGGRHKILDVARLI